MKHEERADDDSSCFTLSRFTILLLALLQFCLFLNHRDITSAHEGRVAVAAREMLTGHDWIVPHSNGQPRILKPPLPYWLTAGLWKVAGNTDVWLARLPAAVCGAIAVLLIIDLGRRVLGRGGGMVAGLVWISTWFIVDEYRKSMADPYLAFFTLLSVWSWIVAHARPMPPTPGQSAAPPRAAFVVIAYIAAALGTLAKGPVILLHLALALIPYHGITRRRPITPPLAHALGLLLFLSIAAPWPVMVARRIPHVARVWSMQLRADQATSGEKSSPPWAYLASLPLTSAPWTVFGVIGIFTPMLATKRRDRRSLWPLTWLAATVVAFSILPMKKNAYLLPAMPAQTLVIAAPIASILRSRRPNAGDRALFVGHAIAAGAAACVVLALVLATERVNLERPGPILASAAIGIFIVIGARSLAPRLISPRTFLWTAVGFALAVHGHEAWIWPEIDNRRSDRSFAEGIVATAGDAPLCVIGDGLREDVLFYLGRTVPVYRHAGRLPEDYQGFAIVTADAMDEMEGRGDEIAKSADRPAAQDRLVLLKIPRDPNLRGREDRR